MHNNAQRQQAATGGAGSGFGNLNQKQLQDLAQNQFNKTLQVDADDRAAWDLIHKVPNINKYLAIAVFVFNLILPGFGTAIAACAGESISKT